MRPFVAILEMRQHKNHNEGNTMPISGTFTDFLCLVSIYKDARFKAGAQCGDNEVCVYCASCF